MKERPILMSAPMVRALLDGSKTQTRRLVKPQPVMYEPGQCVGVSDMRNDALVCQYGQPGDRLWVRESGVRSLLSGPGDQMGLFRHDVPTTPDAGHYWVERTRAPGASYNAAACSRAAALLGYAAKATPSIHMPRWASRILLEIVSVRVERLNDCSDADASAEGCSSRDMRDGDSLACVYARLWESINGAGSWAANPWVWIIVFRRIA